MKRRSVKLQFVGAVMAIVVPLILFLNGINFYYLGLSRQQVTDAGSGLISLYMEQVDKAIGEMDDCLRLLATNDNIRLLEQEDEATRAYAARAISDELHRVAASYSMTDMIFVHESRYDYDLYAYGDGSTLGARERQSAYLRENVYPAQTVSSGGWQPVSVGGAAYVLRYYRLGSVWLGSWVAVATLQSPLEQIDNAYDFSFVFTDQAMQPLSNAAFVEAEALELHENDGGYYVAGAPRRHIIISRPSTMGSFHLYMTFPEQSLLDGLTEIQLAILIISLLSLAAAPLMLALIYRSVLRPLEQLRRAIDAIDAGDMEHRIGDTGAPAEFARIDRAFDDMVRQLQSLRIRAYEDVIEKQRLRLRFLKSQIRPHFFLNALTTISNFAQLGKPAELQRFITCLAEYMRYTLRSGFAPVRLDEELRHVENYLTMQELRFSGTLRHVFDVEPQAAAALVPPMMAGTFVENVIKHALGEQERVTIYLRAEITGGDWLHLLLEDDGAGMTEEARRQLQSPKEPKDGQSVGMWNVQQTLGLMYGGRARLTVEPSELAGTRLELWLPQDAEAKRTMNLAAEEEGGHEGTAV